jgi:hypothetical protein
MYINAEMIPAETIPGTGEGRIKESSGEGDFKYICYTVRNFVNATYCGIPHPSPNNKKNQTH